MSEPVEEQPPKKKKTRNRQNEYARQKLAKNELLAKKLAESAGDDAEKEKTYQLALLATRTANAPTDADRDIDFAYKNSGNPGITPMMAPSLGAWQWYEYARNLPEKFLEICAKREDAKAKAAGSITSQRMEDDRRQAFAVIDRIEQKLTLDVKAIVNELLEKFPEDVLIVVRAYEAKRQSRASKTKMTE